MLTAINQMFCAAVASNDTRQRFISTVAAWLSETPTNLAFADLHDTVDGKYVHPCRRADNRRLT
jgi:hypothetical protein